MAIIEDDANTVAKNRLKSFIERIENLEEEKKATSEDIKDVYAELKGEGFDSKIVKSIVKIRKIGIDAHQEFESVLDTYLGSLGMLNNS